MADSKYRRLTPTEYLVVRKSGIRQTPGQQYTRAHPRVECQDAVWLHRSWADDARAGLATNVSRGGVFVLSDPPLEIGEQLTVEMDTGRGRIRVEGNVVWVRACSPAVDVPAGMGICFQPMAPPIRSLLTAFIDDLMLRRQTTHEQKLEPVEPNDIDDVLKNFIGDESEEG